MRLAYLVSQYPAVNHTYILREIRSLRAQGFGIEIVSIRRPDRPLSSLTAEEREELGFTRAVLDTPFINVAGAHLTELLRRPAGYLRGLALAFRLGRGAPAATLSHLFHFAEAVIAGRWMIARGYSHFHTHYASTVGLLVTRIFPLTMSVTIHGSAEFNDMAAFHMDRKVAASRLVVTIGSFARSQVLRSCPVSQWDKVVTCRLGVDVSLYEPRPEPAGAIPEILCVGQLAPPKAQYVLIEAMRLLRDRGIQVRLRLIGDGPDRAQLEAAARRLGVAEDVVFDGMRNQDEVRSAYRQATVFALASFAEGIPVVLMEAMAMEIPCVATRIMGIPELIEDGVSGLLVPPAEAGPLTDALERLLRDPNLRGALGRQGRRHILEHFSLSANCVELGQLFTRRLN